MFSDCNTAATRVFGRSRHELLGHSPAEFSLARQPDGRDSWDVAGERIRAALEGKPQFFTWINLRGDGSAGAHGSLIEPAGDGLRAEGPGNRTRHHRAKSSGRVVAEFGTRERQRSLRDSRTLPSSISTRRCASSGGITPLWGRPAVPRPRCAASSVTGGEKSQRTLPGLHRAEGHSDRPAAGGRGHDARWTRDARPQQPDQGCRRPGRGSRPRRGGYHGAQTQAEEKLKRMQVQLAHVARLSTVGELAAEIAHELSQPLYAILNYAKASRNQLAAEESPDLEELARVEREDRAHCGGGQRHLQTVAVLLAPGRIRTIVLRCQRNRDGVRRPDGVRSTAKEGRAGNGASLRFP